MTTHGQTNSKLSQFFPVVQCINLYEVDLPCLTLMMFSAQLVETLVNVFTNSPSLDYTHPDDHTFFNYRLMT